MARQLRLEYPGAVWHVHSRGNNRGPIFFCDADRELFLALLAETARRFHWMVLQYVLMTNHFHMVLETPIPTLSKGMKWLMQTYVQTINKRHGRVGSLFQGRFKGHLVEKNGYLLEVLRYIANNPVQAGMVERAEDWKWGSHRALMGYERLPKWMSSAWTLSQFGSTLKTQRRSYGKFVDQGAEKTRAPWEDAVGQLYVGTTEWIASLRPKVDEKPRSNDHPRPQRLAVRPRPARVMEIVAQVFEKTPEEIRTGHGTIEREVVAWLGCYETVSRIGEIGSCLNLRSTSRVSTLIAQCERDLRGNVNLHIAIDRCTDLLRKEAVKAPVLHRESYPGTERAPF